MTAPAAPLVVAQRATANEHLTDPTRNAYERQVAAAVLLALDWIEGRSPVAPVTGQPAEPTERAMKVERTAAITAEEMALRLGGDSVTPGRVMQVLGWWLGFPNVAPVY